MINLKTFAIHCICLSVLTTLTAGVSSQYQTRPAEWFGSEEGRRVAENILTWQSPHGSWPKNCDTATEPYEGDKDKLQGTFDNRATIGELRFLGAAFEATGVPRYQKAVINAVDHILEAQYPNGGWPQFFPLSRGYHRHITFNDGTMIGLMSFLREVAEREPPFSFIDEKRCDAAKAALARGIDCILKAQIKQNRKLTVWCAQHDEQTLAPAWGRAYEPPSLSGSESVGIVRFLMSVQEPSREIVAAVEGAVQWFESIVIQGIRVEEVRDERGKRDRRVVTDPNAGPLWARFYELDSNRPIFLDRDSVVRYSLAKIGQERRGGYAWYGDWAEKLIKTEYPAWRAKHNLPNR
jgi:PelA/Pel-15E family pectate lyase